jgi:branched-chain amino acid transport system permease protein
MAVMHLRKYWPALLLLVIAIAAPGLVSRNWVNVLILTMLFVFLCQAWNIVGGIAGQFSLAHSVFIAAGAYTSTLLYLDFGISPWIGMLAGGAIAAALGAGVAWLSFRYALPPLSFALVTLALAMLALLTLSSVDLFGASGGLSLPMRGTPGMYHFRGDAPYYYIILAYVAVAFCLTVWLYDARPGLYFRAIRDNERAALAIGIDVLRYKMLAMVISAFLTALAGTFYAQYLLYVDPQTFAGLNITVEIILFTVVGGSGTVWGPLLGPLLLVPLGEVLRTAFGGQTSAAHLLIYGVLLVLVIRFSPGGLIGLIARWRRLPSSMIEERFT